MTKPTKNKRSLVEPRATCRIRLDGIFHCSLGLNGYNSKYKSWHRLIQCKVVPPKGLYDPLLPQRIKVDNYEKLIFTWCKECAETRNQDKCEHTVNKKSFIGTWTTDEVNAAIKKGYKVQRVYEVWHFDKTTDDLFKGYIRRFMKIKLESISTISNRSRKRKFSSLRRTATPKQIDFI